MVLLCYHSYTPLALGVARLKDGHRARGVLSQMFACRPAYLPKSALLLCRSQTTPGSFKPYILSTCGQRIRLLCDHTLADN